MLKNTKLATGWRDETIKLLRNRPVYITMERIAKETGLQVPWLSMLHRGKITHPSINMMQTLHEYLISIKS